MRLMAYLRETGETQADFGARVRLSQPAINRYLLNQRYPSPLIISRICEATAHRVTVTDWYQQAGEDRAAKSGQAA